MRVFFKISGVVQGIGYRWFAADAAAKLALTGLVRNCPDGSVEGEAQGERTEIEAFLKELRTGHPEAEITNAETTRMQERKDERNFIIAY